MTEKPVRGSLMERIPDSGMVWGAVEAPGDLVLAKPLSHSTLPESTPSNNFILCHGHLAPVPGEQQTHIGYVPTFFIERV